MSEHMQKTLILTYNGSSPRPFGVSIAGWKQRFDPVKSKTLTLPVDKAHALMAAEPGVWSEYVAPVTPPPLKEKTEVKKADNNGGVS